MNADQAQGLVNRVRDSDAALILGLMIGIYVLYTAFALLLGLPFGGTVNTLQRITLLTAVYAIVVLGLNIHWGYTGLFNIGVAGFMMVGVYVFAMLTGSPDASATTGAPGLGLPMWVGFVGGMVAAALVGAVAALPALRLRADYLAIVTIALAEIIRLTIKSTTLQAFTVFGVDLGTGGASGIFFPSPAEPINRATEPLTTGVHTYLTQDLNLNITQTVIQGWFYTFTLVAVLALVYVLMVRIGNSPFGRVLKGIREDELVAKSLGKDTNRFKIKAFMVGCAVMGLGGILWMGQPGYTGPGSFLPRQTFYIFIAVIIGGAGSNTGSVVGSALFVALLYQGPVFVARIIDQLIAVGDPPATFVGALSGVAPFAAYVLANVSTLRPVLLGAVLIYLVQNRPEGILGHRTDVASTIDLSERDRDDASSAAAADGGDAR